MKTGFAAAFALSLLSAGSLLAQSVTGTWQCAADINNTHIRAVAKISTTEKDSLGGVFYPNIDQNGASLPLGAVSVQGSTVKFAIPALAGAFEGKLAPDSKSMAGTFTLGDNHAAVTFTRATPETTWLIPEPPARPKPLPADADPSFEVKPVNPDEPGRYFSTNNTQFKTHNTSLADMMSFVYGIQVRQIIGAPAWVESEKWDVQAKLPPEGMPSAAQIKSMMGKLLAERFQLSFHRDKKELSVYAIVVGKDGPKLTKSTGDPNGGGSLFFRGLGHLPARNVTMTDFAGVMQSAVLDRPVIDQTHLPGRWDFSLDWTPDEFQFTSLGPRPPAPTDSTLPNLFTAFQQQLGLKLESTKAMADVLVVDKVAKPSDN
jgi:uncharacterized protein (TIGR03435 family)